MYQTELEGVHYELGTSGFLYRSNKLMYDHETKSMWSTLHGEPVVGELVGKGIKLKRGYVVTSTWGQWRKQHPETTVLSLNTGHDRDYGEGVAYRDYFATDKLMFSVPETDNRLLNKAEVVAMRDEKEQLAVSASFLQQHPVYHDKLTDQPLVILTDAAGANRVYRADDVQFQSWDKNQHAVDIQGNRWLVKEDALVFQNKTLSRMPSHRAFWFGWRAQFPQTRLVK